MKKMICFTLSNLFIFSCRLSDRKVSLVIKDFFESVKHILNKGYIILVRDIIVVIILNFIYSRKKDRFENTFDWKWI